ncbi:sigma-54-dependent transcriptional regulator [Thermodesulfobacteriota bacterium]
MKSKILVVDDDTSLRKLLDTVLTAEGYEVTLSSDGQEAVKFVEKQFFDLILMDIRMAQMDGIEALKRVKEISSGIQVIIMTAYASVKTAIDALKSGAYDYLTKPLDIDELKILVARALHQVQLEQDNRRLKERLDDRFNFSNIIANSPSMLQVFELLAQVSPSEANVLITGESGTGKELIANAIHQNSYRKERPFIKVNCAALPENLLESELFGHEKGAFTGAVAKRKGRFREAHLGSIFLDEIGEMSPATQAKILRVLQEREFEPVGSSNTVQVDTRIVAATNKNLQDEIRDGRFREDLYYRLNVINIDIPPLRERSDDIFLLAETFLKKYAEKNHVFIKGFTPMARDMLVRHDWPGNVRELENVVERSVIMARSDLISHEELPDSFKKYASEDQAKKIDLTPGRSLKDVEREMIIRTVEQTGGNRTHAAKILGISRRTLQLKLKDYNTT